MKKIILIILSVVHISLLPLPPDVRSECIPFAQKTLLPKSDKATDIDSFFFTPDHAFDIKRIIIGLIDAEQEMIQVALFRLTDSDISQALIDAYIRGIPVEVIIDAGGLEMDKYSKVFSLASRDIPIYVYQPVELFSFSKNKKSTYQSIMHHKTFLFYNSIGGPVVVCGSLNPTYAAFHGNEECVMIRNDRDFFNGWKSHFEKLKRRCLQQSKVELSRKKSAKKHKKRNKDTK